MNFGVRASALSSLDEQRDSSPDNVSQHALSADGAWPDALLRTLFASLRSALQLTDGLGESPARDRHHELSHGATSIVIVFIRDISTGYE